MSCEDYGRLVLPQKERPRAFVIFYPPATGEKGQQEAEARTLAASGIACLLHEPPYLNRRRHAGGVADPAGEVALWAQAKSEFQLLIREIAREFPETANRLVVVGKNLGGSVAAFSSSACREVKGLIVTGSVPMLSDFWVDSAHPVAHEARSNLPRSRLEEFRARTACLDLLRTLPLVPGEVLVQFGRGDPWIEAEQSRTFTDALSETCRTEWMDDDHAMNAVHSVEKRRLFIEAILGAAEIEG